MCFGTFGIGGQRHEAEAVFMAGVVVKAAFIKKRKRTETKDKQEERRS